MSLHPPASPTRPATCIRCSGELSLGAGFCAGCGTVQRLSLARERDAARWSEGGLAAILASAGALLHLVAASAAGVSLGETLMVLLLTLVIGVPIMVAAAILVGGTLFKTSFGSLKSAIPKLAAVLLVPNAVGMLVGGFLGGTISLVLYFGLLTWQFRMVFVEAAVFAVTCRVLELFVILSAVSALVG